MFKDSAAGLYGDVFKFIRHLLGGGVTGEPVHLRTALKQIDSDLGLGFRDDSGKPFVPMVLKPIPLRREPAKIAVNYADVHSTRFLDFWKQLGVTLETLKSYYANEVSMVHFIRQKSQEHKVISCKTLTISYEIAGQYKIYTPGADKSIKFFNDFSDFVVEGALQLKFKKDFAIITKSMKECIFFREHLDWDCVAGKSENTMITPYFMENVLNKKYKKVFVWLDTDEAGIKAQAKYMEMYPWLIPITPGKFVNSKDATDYYVEHEGEPHTLEYFNNLILGKIG